MVLVGLRAVLGWPASEPNLHPRERKVGESRDMGTWECSMRMAPLGSRVTSGLPAISSIGGASQPNGFICRTKHCKGQRVTGWVDWFTSTLERSNVYYILVDVNWSGLSGLSGLMQFFFFSSPVKCPTVRGRMRHTASGLAS